jgi:peptidoglycan/xylan/chitin deacetylase (PgdA/CDA1 family)
MTTHPFTITTSWDDGHRLDQRVADMLDTYGLRGTFYIARDFLPERLSDAEIRVLRQRHEIGAHTLTHPTLTEVSREQANQEIAGSKSWLEDVTGTSITAFCYPRGANNPALQEVVQNAGYRMARGVDQYHLQAGGTRYNLPTTVHIYPFPLRPVSGLRKMKLRFEPIQRVLPQVHMLGISPLALRSWSSLAIALLERAEAVGGVWHLWGHSWEIEHYQMWDALETVLAAAGRYANASHAVNSELVRE